MNKANDKERSMKMKSSTLVLVLLISAVILSGCLPQPGGAAPSTEPAAPLPTVPPAPTATRRNTPEPAPTPTPSPDPRQVQAAQAEETARAYFAALSAGNVDAAVDLLSSFSLTAFRMSRSDAVAALLAENIAGAGWSDLEILETQVLDEGTLLVQVRYMVAGEDAGQDAPEAGESTEAFWPLRLESGAWRVN
jgi:hypothetical protein